MNYYSDDREDEGILCPHCGGTGSHPYLNRPCSFCNGTGVVQDGYEIQHPVVSVKKLQTKTAVKR